MTLSGLALAVGMLVDEDCRGREHSPQSYPWQAPDHRDSGGRFSDRHADAGRHAFDLRRTFSGSVAVGSSSAIFFHRWPSVVFAMLTSYLLSRTLVPAMASHLLPNFAENAPPSGLGGRFLSRFEHGFERVREAYSRALAAFIAHWRLALTGVSVMIMGSLPLWSLPSRSPCAWRRPPCRGCARRSLPARTERTKAARSA